MIKIQSELQVRNHRGASLKGLYTHSDIELEIVKMFKIFSEIDESKYCFSAVTAAQEAHLSIGPYLRQ